MNARRERVLNAAVWLTVTGAAVWAGTVTEPYWLQFACLVAAAAALRLALRAWWVQTPRIPATGTPSRPPSSEADCSTGPGRVSDRRESEQRARSAARACGSHEIRCRFPHRSAVGQANPS